MASGEMNSVLEILYPREEDRVQEAAPLEVSKGSWASRSVGQPPFPTQTLGAEDEFPETCSMPSKGMTFGVMEVAIKGRLPSDPSRSWDALDPPPDLGLKAEQVFLHSFDRGGKARLITS